MDLIKLRQKSQLTIPKKVREKLGISPGDYFSVEIEDDGIKLTPKVVSGNGEVSLSKKGERGLKEALTDIKEGSVTVYEDADELVNSLME